MAGCKLVKYTGKDVPIYYHIGCGDEMPLDSDWKRLMALRGKEVNMSWDTIDATADDSVGSLRDNIASYLTFSISGDGTLKNSGAGAIEAKDFTKHILNPVATAGQPLAWLKIIFPDITITAFMLCTTASRSAPYDDLATWSFEASAAPSDFGLIVEDTPDPDAPAVTSVTVAPTTASIAVDATTQLTATIAPVGADTRVTWTTSAAQFATVSQTGLVTGVAEGTATITATSKDDVSKSSSAEITVTA